MPVGVYVRTEEHKRKLREVLKPTQFLKCVIPWNKGRKYQIGQGKYIRTEAQKEQLRKVNIGRAPWNKGICGPESHFWNGGKSNLTKKIRSSIMYHQWRADVFKRDGWTCQTCGLRGHGKDIEAHHIIPLRDLLKEAHVITGTIDEKYIFAISVPKMFDVSNGVTLCKACHVITFKERK